MLTPALLGGAQVLLGVDALLRFQGMQSVEEFLGSESELFVYPVVAKVAYCLKVGGHLCVAISLIGLSALRLAASYNVYGLETLLAFQGALDPITWVGIVAANVALQLLGAALFFVATNGAPNFFLAHYSCQKGQDLTFE